MITSRFSGEYTKVFSRLYFDTGEWMVTKGGEFIKGLTTKNKKSIEGKSGSAKSDL